jgi:hypothetical protein
MIIIPKKDIPQDILSNSVLAHVAAAYFPSGRNLNEKLGALRLARRKMVALWPCTRPIGLFMLCLIAWEDEDGWAKDVAWS